jgi:Na+/H+ antiporter NhaD/arsenite permease-like protein
MAPAESVDVGSFPAVAALVVFCLCIVGVMIFVFRPVIVTWKGVAVRLQYYCVPVVAVLLMLACTSMTIADVGRGLVGNDQIKPYSIIVLFMSMAYIASSLDATGVFAWLALRITYASGGRGALLFAFYYLLSALITTFMSNDVCILTLTPIIAYFARATGVDPMPFQVAEYAAANTFGMMLYTGEDWQRAPLAQVWHACMHPCMHAHACMARHHPWHA